MFKSNQPVVSLEVTSMKIIPITCVAHTMGQDFIIKNLIQPKTIYFFSFTDEDCQLVDSSSLIQVLQ